jgi:hypothetical protein
MNNKNDTETKNNFNDEVCLALGHLPIPDTAPKRHTGAGYLADAPDPEVDLVDLFLGLYVR